MPKESKASDGASRKASAPNGSGASSRRDRAADKTTERTDHDGAFEGFGVAGKPARAGREMPAGAGGVVDRRSGLDRREVEARRRAAMGGATPDPESSDEGSSAAPGSKSGLERRRGPGRRLSDFTKRAEEGEMTPEQFLFLVAIDEFKKANQVTFPTWTDVLEVIRLLGYRKTMRSELNLPRAEDWRERGDTPSNVRPQGWERRFRTAEDALDAELEAEERDQRAA